MTVIDRFAARFRGLDRAYGQFKLTGGTRNDGKAEGRATTVAQPIAQSDWESHLKGMTGIGIIPITDSATCYWAVVDIDVYPVDFAAIQERINVKGLPLVICKSKSGGAHVFMFFTDGVPAAKARAKMMAISVVLGYPQVEVFPKQVRLASKRDVGNWLNLPYFNGMKKSTRVALDKDGKELTLLEFLNYADEIAVTPEELDNFSIGNNDQFNDGPPCLQALAGIGFPKGARNNGLFAVAVYLRNKHPDEADWQRKLEEANGTMMQPPLPSREVLMVQRSANRKDYAYPCQKSPLAEHCNKEVCRHRQYGIGSVGETASLENYNFGGLTKIMMQPPVWIFEIDGNRIQLETDSLMSFAKFRAKVVETCDMLLPMVKQHVWDNVVSEKLKTLELKEAPDDSDYDGRLWYLVENFCTGTAKAIRREDILLGRPWFDESTQAIYFRSGDLQRYLEQHHFRGMPAHHVWVTLHARGAGYKTMKIKGKAMQLWYVPIDKLRYQTEDHADRESSMDF